MLNETKWCHVQCYDRASFFEIDPKFEGICHESCDDDSCNLEHEDFGG